MKEVGKHKFQSWLIYASVAAIVILQFFNLFFSSGFTKISGTKGDARFLLSIFEHWHQVFSGNTEWQSPLFFYPIQKTLAFSDGLLGTGLIHHLFRTLGFDLFASYQLTLIIVVLIGFAGTLWVCRRFLKLPPFMGAIVAAIAVSINGLAFQSFHGQLLVFSWLPLFVGLLAAWAQTDSKSRFYWLMGALFLFVILLFTSFYAVWFVVYISLIAILLTSIWAVISKRFNLFLIWKYFLRRKLDIFVSLVVLGLALIVFVDLYASALEISKTTGGFGWERASRSLPNWGDLFYIERYNFLYNKIIPFYEVDPSNYHKLNDYSTGITPILFVTFLFVLIKFFPAFRQNGKMLSFPTYVVISGLTIIICWIFLYRIGDFALWRFPYTLVPGADAIRAPSRLNLVLGQLLAIISVAGIYLLYRNSNRLKLVLMYFVVGIIALEQINFSYFNYDKTEQLQLLAEGAPPKECNIFFVTDPDETQRQSRVVHISANVLSTFYNTKTIMGHSGVFPPEYGWVKNVYAENYLSGVVTWIEHFNLQPEFPICEFDITNREWHIYGTFSELESHVLNIPIVISSIDLSNAEQSDPYLFKGWTRADRWGRWSNGRKSTIKLKFDDLSFNRRLIFKTGALVRKEHPVLKVDVYVNGEKRTRWRLNYPEARGPSGDKKGVKRALDLYTSDYGGGVVNIELDILNPTTPKKIGHNNDMRELGLSVYEIQVSALQGND